MDICPECDHQIVLAAALAENDILHERPLGTAMKKMCEMYGVEVENENK
ncbi:hypothetical protein [Scytonema sp. NUACC26]